MIQETIHGMIPVLKDIESGTTSLEASVACAPQVSQTLSDKKSVSCCSAIVSISSGLLLSSVCDVVGTVTVGCPGRGVALGRR